MAPLLDEEGLLVGVEFPSDGHDPQAHIYDRLHELTELPVGQGAQLIERDRLANDLYRHRS